MALQSIKCPSDIFFNFVTDPIIDPNYEFRHHEHSEAFQYFSSGCDQISFLSRVTKKSAWNLWEVFPEATATFVRLSQQPSLEDVNEALPILERFTVLLYSRSSNCLTTNECRREIFCKGRSTED